MHVELKWVTPDADKMIAYLARVSNPNADLDMSSEKLISFLIRNRHWSPFEMASMCVEINTTRDIGRQILRHRSFSFQEFSQRYAEVDAVVDGREMRFKGTTNRQGSTDERDPVFEHIAVGHVAQTFKAYRALIDSGVAPECARAILPEGFTPTKMYMAGTIRSWIHYTQERTQPNVQKEHRDIALAIYQILMDACPLVFKAVFCE